MCACFRKTASAENPPSIIIIGLLPQTEKNREITAAFITAICCPATCPNGIVDVSLGARLKIKSAQCLPDIPSRPTYPSKSLLIGIVSVLVEPRLASFPDNITALNYLS